MAARQTLLHSKMSNSNFAEQSSGNCFDVGNEWGEGRGCRVYFTSCQTKTKWKHSTWRFTVFRVWYRTATAWSLASFTCKICKILKKKKTLKSPAWHFLLLYSCKSNLMTPEFNTYFKKKDSRQVETFKTFIFILIMKFKKVMMTCILITRWHNSDEATDEDKDKTHFAFELDLSFF